MHVLAARYKRSEIKRLIMLQRVILHHLCAAILTFWMGGKLAFICLSISRPVMGHILSSTNRSIFHELLLLFTHYNH